MERSPWSGLTRSQSLELSDALSDPTVTALPQEKALWRVHVAYCRRAAGALVANDLRGALRAAEIAAAALVLHDRQGASEVVRERHRVIHEDPPTPDSTEPAALSWPAHRPHAGDVARGA